jgi:predicted metal-dependent phosphoesterase TrpH
MYDLHLHSLCSDGDLSPADMVRTAAERGLTGLALTDHNTMWGLEAARTAAAEAQLTFIEGIEVSSFYEGCDVHILGFARTFDRSVLDTGLRSTRQGCRERVHAMVQRCHEAGFTKVSVESIAERYRELDDPSYISFDVARELQAKHALPVSQAHAMTVYGGACYVPYGDWLLTPLEVVQILHQAGGVAVLAHPGIFAHEVNVATLNQLLAELVAAGIDGIEVRHPFHSAVQVQSLSAFVTLHTLLTTAGSDWHGPSRFPENNKQFGQMGVTSEELDRLLARLDSFDGARAAQSQSEPVED